MWQIYRRRSDGTDLDICGESLVTEWRSTVEKDCVTIIAE